MFEVRECVRQECRFRFPVETLVENIQFCPRCRGPLSPAGSYPTGLPEGEMSGRKYPPLMGVLDNLRSAFNVGSIFRIADGVGLSALYLCGITPTPEHPKVAKTALGAETTVPWHYSCNCLHTVEQLRADGVRLLALERTAGADSLFARPVRREGPVALVVGNEKAGIDPAVRDLCDQLVFLPMRGQKESLNVAVAFGIAAYATIRPETV